MTYPSTIEVSRDGAVVDTLVFTQGLIRIGRVPEVKDGPIDVILPSDRVSGLHAQIVVGEAGFTLIDRSRNGTFINGELVQAPRQLGPQDRIEIDVFTLRCERGGAGAAGERATGSTSIEASAVELELDLAPEDEELPVFEVGPDLVEWSDEEQDGGDADASTNLLGPPAPAATPLPSLTSEDNTKGAGSQPAAPRPSERGARPSWTAVVPSRPADALGEIYRHLAGRLGAAAWGRPPRLDASALPRVLESVRQAIAARSDGLPDGARWAEWLARELCGLDPIRALLEDASVTGVVVHGDHGIMVHRGEAREAAASRFSCIESVHAAIERWTGRRLESGPIEHVAAGLTLHAYDRALVPDGPLVVVRRAGGQGLALTEWAEAHALPAAAAELLRGHLARGKSLLVYGSSGVDPTPLLLALRRDLPPGRVVAAIQRASTWSPSLALGLDGHQDQGTLWRCVERLRPDWLIVEELRAADVAALRDLGRHRGGGTIASMQAGSGDAALSRLAALLAANGPPGGGDLPSCRAAIASSFDLVLGLRGRASGGAQIASIAEVRARGELAEIFAWRSTTSSLEATGVDSHSVPGGAS